MQTSTPQCWDDTIISSIPADTGIVSDTRYSIQVCAVSVYSIYKLRLRQTTVYYITYKTRIQPLYIIHRLCVCNHLEYNITLETGFLYKRLLLLTWLRRDLVKFKSGMVLMYKIYNNLRPSN